MLRLTIIILTITQLFLSINFPNITYATDQYPPPSCYDFKVSDLSNPGNPPQPTRSEDYNPPGFLSYDAASFYIYTKKMHERLVTVAFEKNSKGFNEEERKLFSEFVFDTWAIYWKEYGGFPFESYTITVIPNGQFGTIGERGLGFEYDISLWPIFEKQVVAHGIYHAWNGNVFMQDNERKWFVEGVTQYYGQRNTDNYIGYMQSCYDKYIAAYNTGQDVALDTIIWSGSIGNPYLLQYWKGALVAYMLDMELSKTGNHLGQVAKLVYEKFGINSGKIGVTTPEYLNAFNTVSGKDYTDFFSKYIYGTEKLPLSKNDFKWICHDFSAIPEIQANGYDNLFKTQQSEPISIKIDLIVNSNTVNNADWWIAADTPFGWYSYVENIGWQAGINIFKQEPLSTYSSTILNTILLVGDYDFYFAIDDNMDGTLDATWYDTVSVHVFELNFNFPFSIPNATITIDGKADDWAGIPPILNDSIGDSTCGSGTDIKDVYLAMDGKYLYWRLDTSSGAYKFNYSNGVGPAIRFYNKNSDDSLSDDISFEMIGGGDYYSISTKDSSGNWNWHNPGSGYGKISDIAEGKIPLSFFGNNLYNWFWVGFYGNTDVNNPTCDQVSQ
jgi:hypothetical protein